MQLKLQQYIEALGKATDMLNVNPRVPILVRVKHPEVNKTYTFACSHFEPKNIVLPANVTWMCFDPNNSLKYKIAFQRTSKSYDEQGVENNTWRQLYFYAHIWANQSYDPADISLVVNLIPQPAKTDAVGLGRLSQANAESRVVGEGDSRLTDARNPVGHTHGDILAKNIAYDMDTNIHYSTADQDSPLVGMAYVFEAGQWLWRKLRQDDVVGL